MGDLFNLQTYGVLGYSASMALALACTSVGFAHLRAKRDRMRALTLILSSFLFAALFGYLAIISAEPVWLDRTIMQPVMRTVAFLAAMFGWAHLYISLRKEAKANHASRVEQIDRHLEQSNGHGGA